MQKRPRKARKAQVSKAVAWKNLSSECRERERERDFCPQSSASSRIGSHLSCCNCTCSPLHHVREAATPVAVARRRRQRLRPLSFFIAPNCLCPRTHFRKEETGQREEEEREAHRAILILWYFGPPLPFPVFETEFLLSLEFSCNLPYFVVLFFNSFLFPLRTSNMYRPSA